MEITYYVSCFEKKSKKNLKIYDYYEKIKTGFWENEVIDYRTGKKEKTSLPAVTISGLFPENRKISEMQKHSGFICIDCDFKDNEDILTKISSLQKDEYINAIHKSVSGKGIALYFKIKANKHIESFQAISDYLANEYKIIIDQACKDVSRLRFISYDPEIYVNQKSKTWSTFIDKKNIIPDNFNPVFDENDISFCIKQIKDKGIDLTSNYADWIKIGFAFVNEFKNSGRDYFHAVSSNYAHYSHEKTNKKYDSLLKSNNSGITIGTFFHLCKQNGIAIKTEKTKKIENIAKVRRKSIGKNGGCKDEITARLDTEKYLQNFENIHPDDAKNILDKVFSLDAKALNEKTEESELLQVIEFINSLDVKYNEVTKKTEINGEDITDYMLNSVYITSKEVFQKTKISKELIGTILESDRIKSYNPFFDFIEKNSHIKGEGTMLRLIDAFTLKDENYQEITKEYILKWLISIIASIHGTYSLLTLVLIGDQGTNKTNFFRWLLPAELQKYYAEQKLDEGKDSEILMSEKLIIIDDEFGGKSKKEATKFKEISSKDKITHRKAYGRYTQDFKRIAVLGGTSNEIEIIVDYTGNRRILPVHIQNIDMNKLREIDNTELFMEMYHTWKKLGDKAWMLTKADIERLDIVSKDNQEKTIEEDMILKFFKPAENVNDFDTEFLTTTEMMNICEEYLSKQRLYHKKFGQMLRKLNFKRVVKNCKYGYIVIRLHNSANNM
jgi:predicted P-loop ATPase